ncbi:adhesin [Thermoanaerobacterium thermosaccharolyticum]|jgi:Fe-S cluster assembly iron-binding protein IscA|uniref:HesB/IscA family protein n=1 Tax=Thermoanaerobacterium thermosaccharolyticum TaxID=1517 RepID=UPI003DA843BD
MVKLSDEALSQLRKILNNLPIKNEATGLRIYTVPTEEGFLAGFAVADNFNENDEILEYDDVYIYIDKSDLNYLKYSVIEYDNKYNRFFINMPHNFNALCSTCARYSDCDYIN